LAIGLQCGQSLITGKLSRICVSHNRHLHITLKVSRISLLNCSKLFGTDRPLVARTRAATGRERQMLSQPPRFACEKPNNE